jgi:hypothetical protein
MGGRMKTNQQTIGVAILCAAALGFGTSTIVRAADGLLDQALGTSATQPAPTPAPNAPGAASPVATPAPFDPDAAKRVDDNELTRKLTDQAGPAPDSPMSQVLDRMGQSAQRLTTGDAGPDTQETQKRIVLNLDQLIDIARQQQQSGGGKPDPNGKKGQGQSRQQSNGKGDGNGPHQDGGNSAAQASELPGGSADTPESSGKEIRETGTEWGNLPARDRDLIIHGSKEQSLPAYKDMVQRYYQALADLAKNNNR